MQIRKQAVDDRAQARREAIFYLLAGLAILVALTFSTSLWPGLPDQLIKSLKAAIRMYVGF
jgi:hypothetical protein